MNFEKLRRSIKSRHDTARQAMESSQQATAEAQSLQAILAQADDLEASLAEAEKKYRNAISLFDDLTSEKRHVVAMDRLWSTLHEGVDRTYPALERVICIGIARNLRDQFDASLRRRYLKAPEDAMRSFITANRALLESAKKE